MAMTGQNVVNLARGMIKDDVPDANNNYRWSDTLLLGYLNQALQDLNARQPWQFLEDSGYQAPANASALNETLTAPDSTLYALAYTVASMALFQDSDDPANRQQAEFFLKLRTAYDQAR